MRILAFLFLVAVGCQSTPPASLEGLWMSQGYGLFAEVGDGIIDVREVSAVSCIPWDGTLTQTRIEADGSWLLEVFGDPAGARFSLDSDSVARLQPNGTVSAILFSRTDLPPPICAQAAQDTPRATSEVFWHTFREHYPFFAMKGVDWEEVGDSMRQRITDETTPEELFGMLSEAIAPLEDVHVSLSGGPLGRASFAKADPELGGETRTSEAFPILEQRFARALEIIESRYLVGELRPFCNGHLRYGELEGGIGYLYLDQEGGYTDEPGFDATLEVFQAALDTVFTALEGAGGLVLDVRKNYGGSDVLSLALASRLTTIEYLAYAKVARSDPDDPTRFTPRQERMVPTTSRPGFSGPVVQLTGPYTISAGETLTQALMGREPAITRIGQNTQGVFSDVLSRTLPNGWALGLPNELFLTEHGEYFDGPGIPPDIEIPVFRSVDLDAGLDPALERAIAFLSRLEG
jgi:hypothetical protein